MYVSVNMIWAMKSLRPCGASLLWTWYSAYFDRQQRIESRSRYVKERLEETKEVAKNCGISVDMVLMIKLSDVLYALQTGDEWFKSHVDYNAK